MRILLCISILSILFLVYLLFSFDEVNTEGSILPRSRSRLYCRIKGKGYSSRIPYNSKENYPLWDIENEQPPLLPGKAISIAKEYLKNNFDILMSDKFKTELSIIQSTYPYYVVRYDQDDFTQARVVVFFDGSVAKLEKLMKSNLELLNK